MYVYLLGFLAKILTSFCFLRVLIWVLYIYDVKYVLMGNGINGFGVMVLQSSVAVKSKLSSHITAFLSLSVFRSKKQIKGYCRS